MMKKKRFLIFDGNLLLHKSHGIHKTLGIRRAGKIILTGIPYGFLRSIVRLNSKYGSCHNCVAFDASSLSLVESRNGRIPKPAPDVPPRYKLLPTYKENRGPMKPEIYDGKLLLDSFLEHMNVTTAYASSMYEGDDVVSYVVDRCRLHCERVKCIGEVIIVSDDKDFNQLIQERNGEFTVKIHKRGDEVMDLDSFQKKFGFHSYEFIIYLALVGDTSDDIPGIKGIGPKKATELLKQGQNAILGHLDSSQAAILERNIQLIRLSISQNVISHLAHKTLDRRALSMLLKRYKMVSFLREEDQRVLKKMKAMKFLKEC